MEGGVRLGIWRLTFSEAFTIDLDVLSRRNNAARKQSILYLQPKSWKLLARRVTRSSTTLKTGFMLGRFLIGWTSGAAKSGLRASTAIRGSILVEFWEFLAIALCSASDAA